MKRLLAVIGLALCGATGTAHAGEIEVTAQAKAARAEFLLRAAPPATPAAICLVDTGVDVNPDTAGVIARLSLPRLDGSDQSPTSHGTRMAMFMGAQSNGFGMVGLWPHARTVSVQSNFPGQEGVPIGGYIGGIQRCDVESPLRDIKVVVVAVSTELQSSDDAVLLADAVVTARNHGLNVVAAAGNLSGQPAATLASMPGELSVGAVDAATGELCAGSPADALILAPGCSIEGADPSTGQPGAGLQATSAAAAVVGAAIAALRTWRPDLTPDAAQQLITATASGRRLDLTAAFEAAGLHAVVAPPPSAQPPPPPVAAKQRLAKPRLTVRQRGRGARRTLRIRATNRPPRATMTVRVHRGAGAGKLRRIATRTVRSSKLTLRVTRRWTRVTAYFTDPSGRFLQSEPATVSSRR